MKMKQIFFVALVLLLTACHSQPSPGDTCPPISIKRESARTYQNNGFADTFQINLIGFESNCYVEPSTKRHYASIAPIFKVRRLENSDTTALDVNFFIKSSINAEDYLGIREYNQVLTIPADAKEHIIKGRTTETRLSNPPYNGDFTLEVGLFLQGASKDKAKGMFDIDYRYLTEEEIAAQNLPAIENVYLEVGADEEVIYSEIDKRPQVVKKNRPQNDCE